MLFEYEFDLDSLINNARGNNGILSVQQANGLTLNIVTIYAFIIRRFKFVKEYYSLRLHLSIVHLLTGQTMWTRSTKTAQLLSGQTMQTRSTKITQLLSGQTMQIRSTKIVQLLSQLHK